MLDIIELKKAKKIVLYKELKEKHQESINNNNKNNSLKLSFYYYKDKYVNFKDINLISKHKNKGIYFNKLFLDDKFQQSGYEIGIIYDHLIIWFDSLKKSIGFKYNTNFLNHNLEISKRNLVYSYYSKCSTKFMDYKVSLSKYKAFNKNKNLWYSLSYEKIKNNSILTPQFDTDLIKKGDFIAGINGWYQFNSKTECYYSPKQIDNTFIHLKYTKKNIQLKGAIGYSFKERAKLWEIALLYNTKNFDFKCKKSFSIKNGIYSYIECKASLYKKW